MVILEAGAYSSLIPKLTRTSASGTVHSVFRRVMNISWGGRLITVGDERLDELPNGVMVSLRQLGSFHELPIGPGDSVRGSSRWTVGNTIIIDLSSAKVFPSKRSIGSPLLPETKRRVCLKQAQQIGELLAPSEGLAPLWSLAKKMASETIDTDHTLSPLLQRAFTGMSKLVAGTRKQDWNMVRGAAGSLVGLGIGLTPSGDDMLTGFMAAQVLVHSARGEEHRAFPMAAAILCQAEGRTNAISQNFLQLAARGEMTKALARYITSLAAHSDISIEDATSTLFSYGASSGAELGLGAFLGVSVIQ